MNPFYIVNLYSLKIGDRLIRTKGVFSTHHGIYVGIHNGVPMVAENQIGHGVHYLTLAEFLLNNAANLKEVRRFPRGEYARSLVISDANSLLGTSYDLINFNCEHFADLIQFGRASSKQVDNAMAGLGLAAVLGIIFLLGGGGK